MTAAAAAKFQLLYVLMFLVAIDHRFHAAIEALRWYYGAI